MTSPTRGGPEKTGYLVKSTLVAGDGSLLLSNVAKVNLRGGVLEGGGTLL